MLEIVLNELSCTKDASSVDHTTNVYLKFFYIADHINALKISNVRILSTDSIANISLCGTESLTIKDWLRRLPSDDRKRYLGYLAQFSFIPNNPYYRYNEKDVVGFGYAFENDLGTISFFSDEIWSQDIYLITREFLPDADSDVIIETFEVNNYLISQDNINHAVWANNCYKSKQTFLINNIISFETFWAQKDNLLPNLLFSDHVFGQISLYQSVEDKDFKKALRGLQEIDYHCTRAKQNLVELDNLPIPSSNESEATLQQYGAQRNFIGFDKTIRLYTLHLKLGKVRIYIRILHETKQIEVVYIGPHLKTKRYH